MTRLRTTLILITLCLASSVISFPRNFLDRKEMTKKRAPFTPISSDQIVGDVFPEASKFGYIPIAARGEMWYWYFDSRDKPDTDPLLIWFSGGPGCSSEFAVFFENGPMTTDGNTAQLRKDSWNNNANVLFMDQPLGTGYSTVNKDSYALNREDVVRDFYEFITKLFDTADFAKFKGRPLYLAGESYGGHWLPYISNYLYLKKNPDVNIQGVAIGNGYINPATVYANYNKFSLDVDLITQDQYFALKPVSDLCVHLISNKNPLLPADHSVVCNIIDDSILLDPKTGQPRFNVYNYKLKDDYVDNVAQYLAKPEVNSFLNPKKEWVECDPTVYEKVARQDMFLDATQYLIPLLNDGVKIWIYDGMLDWICNWEQEEKTIDQFEWLGTQDWQSSTYSECPYGWCRQAKNLRFIKFKDAGHMVPHEQPVLSTQMINELMHGK